MDKRAQLQFWLLSADAQRCAIRRLALSGLRDEEIAQQTGWAISDIRQVLSSAATPGQVPWISKRGQLAAMTGKS